VIDEAQLQSLVAQQLRDAMRSLMAEVVTHRAAIERHAREAAFNRATIDKLTHEMAVLKRLKFAAKPWKSPTSSAPMDPLGAMNSAAT
jgi:hypothetical protein